MVTRDSGGDSGAAAAGMAVEAAVVTGYRFTPTAAVQPHGGGRRAASH